MAMTIPPLVLPILFTLLAIDALIEVGLIGSMVGYLHQAHEDVPFQIAGTSSTPQFGLYPKPAHILVNQGHTSNGAAGTALILVSVLGTLVLWLEKRGRKRSGSVYAHVRTTSDPERSGETRRSRSLSANAVWLYPAWVAFTVLSFLLTLSALIYTFVVTAQTDASHSHIDLAIAAATSSQRVGDPPRVAPYPDDSWTPENWYKAVLKLDFEDDSLKGDIRTHVTLMVGWRWNLIPLLLLGFATMCVAVLGYMERRKGAAAGGRRTVREKHISATSE